MCFSTSQQYFDMGIPNDSSTDVNNKTTPNDSNTIVGIAISHEISRSFVHGLYGQALGFLDPPRSTDLILLTLIYMILYIHHFCCLLWSYSWKMVGWDSSGMCTSLCGIMIY